MVVIKKSTQFIKNGSINHPIAKRHKIASQKIRRTKLTRRFTCYNYSFKFIHFIYINSLAPGRCDNAFQSMIAALIIQKLQNSSLITKHTCYETALRWIPQNLTNEKSTLVQVMTWHCQATNHYLRQCWPRSMSTYDIIRPQWVISWKCCPDDTDCLC